MFNIIKNTCNILFKRKSFIITTIVLPLVLIFAFSALYSSNSSLKVVVINEDKDILGKALEEKLNDINRIEIINIDKDKNYEEALMLHRYEMVISISEDFTNSILNGEKTKVNIYSISDSDMKPIVKAILESEVKSLATLYNNVSYKEKDKEEILKTFKASKPEYNIQTENNGKVSINNSLGMIIYLIFVCSGLGCSFLLEDEKLGTKQRVLMGKVSENKYYGALITTFFVLSSIPVFEYYIVSKLLGYEFGFENTWILIILMLLVVLFAISFNVILASIIKNKSAYTSVSLSFTIPLFMLSGAFWPYDFMSETLQKVGNILPPRWFLLSVEKLQNGEGIIDILPMMVALILLTVFLYLLSVFFTRNKIVLIKNNK